jgi:hypothetical protein
MSRDVSMARWNWLDEAALPSHGKHASRAQFVAVPAKLGDKGERVDFICGGVVKDVNRMSLDPRAYSAG